jgi:stage III sporulation protein SpoIIIAA
VLDLGRRPEARFIKIISWQDIDYTTKRISKFSNENRAGIERTLHRISCIRNRFDKWIDMSNWSCGIWDYFCSS